MVMAQAQIKNAIAEMKDWIERAYSEDHHLRSMIPKMEEMAEHEDAETREKLMRWIGFMQGSLWTDCYFTVDEFRAMNTKDIK